MADHEFTGTLSVTDKIGIGITSPIAQLHLFSSTAAASQAFLESGGALLKLSVDASGAKLGTDNAFSLSFLTNDSPRIAIDAVGNVGIGTTPTLTEKLTINGNLKATSFLGNGATLDGIVKKAGDTITGSLTVQNTLKVTDGAITPAAGNSENAGIMFPKDPSGGSGDAAWIRYYSRTGEATTLEIGTSNDNNDHIGLIASGNVGIGTNEPSNKLQVVGNTGIRQNKLYLSGGEGWSSLSYNAYHNDANGDWIFPDPTHTSVTIEMDDRRGAAARFEVYATTAAAKTNWVQRLAIDGDSGNVAIGHNGGAVGIGTSTPDRKLVVRGGETSLEQEGWQTPTFQNGWVNYSTEYNFAAYFKDSLGVIHLRGLVKNGSGTIFTLPEGYRPARRELFGVATHPNVMGRIDVLSDGQVYMVAGNNGWISLDGITFKAGGRRIFFPFPIELERIRDPIALNP